MPHKKFPSKMEAAAMLVAAKNPKPRPTPQPDGGPHTGLGVADSFTGIDGSVAGASKNQPDLPSPGFRV